MAPIGYSGTSLAKKLGYDKPPLTVWTVHTPKEFKTWLSDLPAGVIITIKETSSIEAAHIFVVDSAEMNALLSRIRHILKQNGFVWVSWYKKSAKIPTDITEDLIREIAIPLGFVDVKVCAIDSVWSGLKLVIRKSERI